MSLLQQWQGEVEVNAAELCVFDSAATFWSCEGGVRGAEALIAFKA